MSRTSSADRHVTEELCAYLDGELSPGDCERVERHLEACGACQSERRLVEGTLAGLGQLERLEPSPGLRRAVLTAIDDAPAAAGPSTLLERVRGWLHPRYLVPASAVAAAAVVFAVAGVHNHHAATTGGEPAASPDEIAMAERLDLLQDLDVLEDAPADIDAADLDVVAHLHELGD